MPYTTVDKVGKLLQVTFGANTSPTTSDVQAWINSIEDEIDRITHHSWKEKKVTDEYYDYNIARYPYNRTEDWSDRGRTYLKHRDVRTFDTNEGDKLEVWNGSIWEDYIANFTEGRGNDFWVEYDRGIIHFANRYPFRRRNGVRMTYRYGDTSIPKDIELAASMLTSIQLLTNDDYSVLFPEGTENIPLSSKAELWDKRVKEILDRYTEIIVAND